MTQSGKMLLLDRLLDGLFKKGHKVRFLYNLDCVLVRYDTDGALE